MQNIVRGPRQSMREIMLQRGTQLAGRKGRAKQTSGSSFTILLWPIDIRPNLMTGNSGNLLKIEDPLRRDARPAIQRRMFDPQPASQSDDSTGFFSPYTNQINHKHESRLSLHNLSSDLVGAKW